MTEQEKRKKVIKGLECCTQHGSMCGLDCNGYWGWTDGSHTGMELFGEYRKKCPYGNCETGCVKTLTKDALALLKAQEPRVMTLAEVARCSFCWVEDDQVLFPALFIGMEKRANGRKCNVFLAERPDSEDCEFWYDLDDYNKRYIGCRCWTSRPTDEQREETPWLSEEKTK